MKKQNNSFCNIEGCNACKQQKNRFEECVLIWERKKIWKTIIRFLKNVKEAK